MPPSTQEEIATQHAEAVRLVEEGMACAPHKELGEISLADKGQPTFPGEQEEKKEEPLKNSLCFSTRGTVDVSLLQSMVEEGYNLDYRKKGKTLPKVSPSNYWDPRNATKHNVSIVRPSHDAWGIGKIVLLFCDDFLSKIYQMPWWKDFESALQPILNVCLTPGSVLLRVLLASLPPGVTIPVHHDTGEWVKSTHRVHVPIIVKDPSRILFRCGPNPDSLQRIDCTPGHVFEINNQAKHTVSNCAIDSRVHLILDYMEGPGPERTVLEPGECLSQTRRSIDRIKDMRKRPTPSYIILGAQKAGTTSLYDYINQHPWVALAKRRETHCLDWRWNDKLTDPQDQLAYCRKFFYTEELETKPSCLTGDSTPSYLIDSRRVIPRIQSVFDWKLRFFVVMRDPVKRAHSQYAMVTSTEGTQAQLKTRGTEWRGKTFRGVIRSELILMDECGLIPYWNIEKGEVDMDSFNSFCGSKDERTAWDHYLEMHVPLNTGSYGLFTRGMYALQLRPWLEAFDREQFLFLRLESMKNDGVQESMQKVWAHLDLPSVSVRDESVKNSREYNPMDCSTALYLQRFFAPHNCLLAQVLGSQEWTKPWPYEEVP